MTVNDILRTKKERGMTNKALSEKSGIPVSTLQKILSGTTRSPRYDTMAALSAALDMRGDSMSSLNTDPEENQENKKKKVNYLDMPVYSPGMVCEAEPACWEEAAEPEEEDRSRYFNKKPGEYNLEDYYDLPDDIRVELIDGVFYDMAAPTTAHQYIAGEVFSVIKNFLSGRKGKCMVFVSPIDVQLDLDDKTMVQPDVVVVCQRSKLTPARIVGAPDFVVEVLSPSTHEKDIHLKGYKYINAGVREYWMVDPLKKKIIVCIKEGEISNTIIYGYYDKVPVGIFNNECVVDFGMINGYVDSMPEISGEQDE